MSPKMFCLKRGWTLKYLMKIFLVSGIWPFFCTTLYVETGKTEMFTTLPNETQSYFVNDTIFFRQQDYTKIPLAGSFRLHSSEVESDVARQIRTDMSNSLAQLTTRDYNRHEYEDSSPIAEKNHSEPVYELREDECVTHKLITFTGEAGVIHGLLNSINWPRDSPPYCDLKIVVPEGKYVLATLDSIRQMEDILMETSEDPNIQNIFILHKVTSSRYFPMLLSGSNHIFLHISKPKRVTEFSLRFTTSEEDLRMTLPLVQTSPTSGYVTTWGFEDDRRHPCFMNASRTVHVPHNFVVMVSFPFVDIQVFPDGCINSYIQLYEIKNEGNFSLKMKICFNSVTPALVLNNSIQVRFFAVTCDGKGFKMIFTFHPVHEAPAKLDSGLWDCSFLSYYTFKQHLECNLELECQGGEDEGSHCPFSSPSCNGSVAVANKCYVFFKSIEFMSWSSASRECRNRGGNLANIKNKQERDALEKIYQFQKSPLDMHIGLSTYDGSLSPQYKKVLAWSDGTVAYDYIYLTTIVNLAIKKSLSKYDNFFCFMSSFNIINLIPKLCVLHHLGTIPLCEFYVSKVVPQESVLIPLVNSEHITKSNDSRFVSCPDGHFTFAFLSCDKASRCGVQTFPLYCQTWMTNNRSVLTAMFVCLDGSSNLPYSLVCDFRPDCPHGSDESFCTRDPHCDGFRCRNGQCIEISKRCDVDRDCWDASDEDCNMFQHYSMSYDSFANPPAVIDFGLHDDLIFRTMSPSDACPDTHFRCPPDGYCLPIYVRCNGVYDCPYHEDEEDCVSYTCPGFYRCRASSVCVHVDHMCDGRPQCPQHDDELFCELTCPQGCLCQGLAFVCSVRFNAHTFPAMRYLDASGSGMSTSDLAPSIYLVWLSLAACDLQVLTNMSLPNLQTLDLSDNIITWLDMSYFMHFEKLRALYVAGNPLQSLFLSSTAGYSLLTHLDMSRTLLKSFKGDALSSFPDLHVFNLSFVPIRNLFSDSFKHTTKLSILDLRGNDIKKINSDTFVHLKLLRFLYASYYTLCCKEFLPAVDNLLCFSPIDSFSSCHDLLHSKFIFVVIWTLCLVSLTGNVCSTVYYKMYTKKENVCCAFSSLMINLNISDLLMGVYLLVIGSIDVMYRDHYVWYEQSWSSGYLCQFAGFLYLLSTEVSCLMLFLMTIERLTVIRFCLKIFHGRLLPVACFCTWVISLVVAILPFLPSLGHLDSYRQNSVCAPLPVYNDHFIGWPYLFGGVIVPNLVLSLLADIIYTYSVSSLSVSIPTSLDQTKTGDKILARRLFLLLTAKTFSCFLMCVIGLTTQMGISYPREVISSVTFLVCPLNTSINPVLIALSVYCEARRKSQRQRLLKVLQSRCQKP